MNSLLGTFDPLTLPGLRPSSARPTHNPLRATPPKKTDLDASAESTSILPFPYLPVLHSLIEQGRIWEARNLFDIAGNFVPQDSKIREALAPPRVKRSTRNAPKRSAEFRWLDSNGAQFRGKWVALIGDSLVASAASLKELLVQLSELRLPGKPLVHHID